MSLANNDLPQPTRMGRYAPAASSPDLLADAACMQAFEQLRQRTPGFWQALPVCGTDSIQEFDAVLNAALQSPAAEFPYAAIAAEAERPLGRGIRAATPVALTLLAAIALGRDGAADGAQALARTALEVAARLGTRTERTTRALHAALLAPSTSPLERTVADLAALCEEETLPPCLRLYLAGNGLMAAMPLPELARHVERTAGRAAGDGASGAVEAELAVRAQFLLGLTGGQAGPLPAAAEAPPALAARFGFWATCLQAAVYDGDQDLALRATAQADALAGPLLPAGDRAAHHLFAVLALSQSDEAAAAGLELHCQALRRLARQLSCSGCAVLQCAEAARARHRGAQLDALRGFEGAASEAGRQGRHGLAALAWEQAARQAQASGLGAALRCYRREALASCERWGAGGRAAALRQSWGEDSEDGGCGTDHERMREAGRVGELGISIAHEVNQPLAAISLHAAAARMWLRRNEPNIERALSSLSLISEAGQHAGDIVRSIQRLASRKEQDMGSVPVDQTIVDTLRLLHRRLRKHGIEVELALGLGDCAIHASRIQLQQVLTNLLVNAVEALAASLPDNAPRRICIHSRRHGEHEVELAVADNGPGIPPQLAGRVFGSLFSTKPNSTGMGLSISLAIVRAHGGRIDYEPCEPHGACFRFRLPVQSSHP